VAQHVVGGQGYRFEFGQRLPDCGSGSRQTGQFFSPGLTSRLALHLGQVTLMSLMPGSWLICLKRSGGGTGPEQEGGGDVPGLWGVGAELTDEVLNREVFFTL